MLVRIQSSALVWKTIVPMVCRTAHDFAEVVDQVQFLARSDWVRLVHQPMTEKEVERIRACIARSRPYGSEDRQNRQAEDLGWWHTLRPKGRPSK